MHLVTVTELFILCPYWEITKQSSVYFSLSVSTPMSVQCVCICWSRPCAYTNGWTDLSAFWDVELSGPKEPCVGWVLNFPPPKQRKRHFYGNIHGCAVCPGFPIVKYSRCFRLPLFRKQTEPLHGGGQNKFSFNYYNVLYLMILHLSSNLINQKL